jgi:hypothetical protein
MLMACYEAPVMLDVAEFVAVAGSCATGGGTPSPPAYDPTVPQH